VSIPKRIQRRRTKGWKLPPNTVCVTRPGKWGNSFTVAEYGTRLALFNHRQRMRNLKLVNPSAFDELRGKDLACWCPLGEPCHADVLLEIANS
jgi:hypothetical protein